MVYQTNCLIVITQISLGAIWTFKDTDKYNTYNTKSIIKWSVFQMTENLQEPDYHINYYFVVTMRIQIKNEVK